MRLWHDDTRPAPEGWVWVRTNDEAKELLRSGNVVECSLDHDLGCDPTDGVYARGTSPHGDGRELVRWMIHEELVPDRVTVHSMNPVGGMNMVRDLRDCGYKCAFVPYRA